MYHFICALGLTDPGGTLKSSLCGEGVYDDIYDGGGKYWGMILMHLDLWKPGPFADNCEFFQQNKDSLGQQQVLEAQECNK